MKKRLLSLLLLVYTCTTLSAQVPDQGALQIPNGFLIYVQNPKLQSYTVKLLGDVGLENYPILRNNEFYFIIETAPKNVFGSNDKSRLEKFMAFEFKKLNSSTQLNGEPQSQIKLIDSTLFNLWNVTKTIANQEDREDIEVIKYYYLDFIIGETLFRIQNPATEIDDKAARISLYKIYKKMHFYTDLNVGKLQDKVYSGQYHY